MAGSKNKGPVRPVISGSWHSPLIQPTSRSGHSPLRAAALSCEQTAVVLQSSIAEPDPMHLGRSLPLEQGAALEKKLLPPLLDC